MCFYYELTHKTNLTINPSKFSIRLLNINYFSTRLFGVSKMTYFTLKTAHQI